MHAAAGAGGPSLRVHEVLRRWAPAYRQRFDATMPPRHREVLDHLQACRTPAQGGALHYCPACGTRHYAYHSCNDRHCPKCGQTDADHWLADHTALLLPVPYFLVTFTVPEPLRPWMRAHPTLAYRDSATRRWTHFDLGPFEFLRRFLQHVLPSGFHRVRRFGWLHPGRRRAFNRVRALLHQPPVLTQAQQATWLGEGELKPPDPALPNAHPSTLRPLPTCPRCHQPMVWVGSWRAGQTPLGPRERAPP